MRKILVNGSFILITLTQLVFLILKTCNIINWSWWLVMLPVLLYVGTYISAVIIAIVTSLIWGYKE